MKTAIRTLILTATLLLPTQFADSQKDKEHLLEEHVYSIFRDTKEEMEHTYGIPLHSGLKFNYLSENIAGKHQYRNGNPIITINRSISLQEMRATIKHELAHNLMAEISHSMNTTTLISPKNMQA